MRRWDLNPRSPAYETDEDDQTPLPRETYLVGLLGFEPRLDGLKVRCANR